MQGGFVALQRQALVCGCRAIGALDRDQQLGKGTGEVSEAGLVSIQRHQGRPIAGEIRPHNVGKLSGKFVQ